MRPNKVKALWREGKPVTAGWISTGNPYIAEIMANAGYDALIIDMQHGMGVTTDRAIACLQAISTTDTVPMVRISWNDPQVVQFVLDAGAYGVIVPLVNTPEDATMAAGASRYPPLGYRSIGPNRARLYGGPDYAQYANDEIIVLAMVETMQSVENLEEMARTPGLDGFYIGPADLALAIGITPGPNAADDPRHAAACQRVVDVSKAAGVIPCHHGSGPDEAARRFAQGFMMCQIGSDANLVGTGAAAALKATADARTQS
jgi:4-hydroxy-2-oxoheptanedioate aldolase